VIKLNPGGIPQRWMAQETKRKEGTHLGYFTKEMGNKNRAKWLLRNGL